MSEHPLVILDNIRFLEQGILVLQKMDEAVYECHAHPFEQGGIGRHMRHVLDHYALFWDGLGGGVVDFDDRARDSEVEQNRLRAVALLETLRSTLTDWMETRPDLDRQVRVCHNGAWCQSSVGRELQHLINHTVHHYAFIGLILRLQGAEVDDTFGVAPSTYQAQLAK